jgi:hypothetical protein
MFPSLDSPLDILQRAQDFWDSAAFWGLMIAGVLVAICGPALSTYRSKLEDKIKDLKAVAASQQATDRGDKLETELTKANQSLAEANRALVSLAQTSQDISTKVTNRITVLTPEVRRKLVDRLKKLPPRSVGCVSLNQTPETTDFGGKIKEVLRDAGCLSPSEVHFSNSTFSGIPQSGLIVDGFGAEGKPVAEELVAAFKEAGIPNVILSDGRAVFAKTGSHAQVTIGAK